MSINVQRRKNGETDSQMNWAGTKKALRELVFLGMRYLGGFAICRWRRRDDILIFMLHGTVDREKTRNWEPLRPQHTISGLERAIQILSRSYTFGSMDDLEAIIRGDQPAQRNLIVFTCDDGYRNNLQSAFPLFKKYGIPLTVYVSTGHIENRTPFWFDRLDYVLQCQKPGVGRIEANDCSIVMNYGDRNKLSESYKVLRQALKNGDRDDSEAVAEIDRIAEELESRSGKRLQDVFEDDPFVGLLTAQEISEASNESDLSFGSHTVNHVRLGLVDRPVVRVELSESKAALDQWTGVQTRHFAYPDGSCNREAADEVRAAGYATATIADEGICRIGDDLFLLKRCHLPFECSETALLAIACGARDTIDTFVAFWRRLLRIQKG